MFLRPGPWVTAAATPPGLAWQPGRQATVDALGPDHRQSPCWRLQKPRPFPPVNGTSGIETVVDSLALRIRRGGGGYRHKICRDNPRQSHANTSHQRKRDR